MRPIDFSEANKTLVAPKGKEGEILDLRVRCENGVVTSVWSPDAEERRLLYDGCPIILAIQSGLETQPPVSMGVLKIDRVANDGPITMPSPYEIAAKLDIEIEAYRKALRGGKLDSEGMRAASLGIATLETFKEQVFPKPA